MEVAMMMGLDFWLELKSFAESGELERLLAGW
jgi:hypothetical protein